MSNNDTTVQASSQPVEATQSPATKSDERSGNLSVAEAAKRLLNMESESAKSAAQTDQNAQAQNASDQSVAPDAAQAESAEADATEANAEDSNSEDVPSHDISAELKKKIDRRIGKEVAKRKALEAQLNELRVAVSQQQSQQPAQQPAPVASSPQGSLPLEHIDDFDGLAVLRKQAFDARKYAQEQLDNDDFEPIQVGDNLLDKKAFKTILRNANSTIDEDIPARTQFLEQKSRIQQMAYQSFPFLKDKSAPEYVQAQQAYIAMPWLKKLPNADWIIGVQIEGLKAMAAAERARQSKSAKPAPVVSTKPPFGQTVVSSSGSDGRSPSATKNQSQIDSMRSQMSKKGGVTANEAAQFLLARELSKQTR